MHKKIPVRLYKYKSFSVDSIDLLVSDSLYFADPTTFNDPLDCNPSVVDDIEDVSALNDILHKLVKDNYQKELEKAAAKIKYKGQKTLEKIQLLGDLEARKLIDNIAQGVDFFGDPHAESICYHIKRYLLKNYAVGVLSLAEKYNCPLMWSHYADQHKGFCIGYDVSIVKSFDIHPVDYNGKRFVRAQQIYDMLFNNNENIRILAKREIEKIILLNKSSSWKYESEYRVICNQGLQDSRFRLSDVTFGFRFKETAKFTVMKALQARQGEIDFYEISLCNESFELKRKPIILQDEVLRQFPISNYEFNRDVQNAMCDSSDEEEFIRNGR